MRKIEVSKRRKAMNLLISWWLFGFGIVVVSLCVARPFFDDMSDGERVATVMVFLSSVLMGIKGLVQLYRNWYQGRIHTIFLINSRTLAVLPAGKAPIFIKRDEGVEGLSLRGIRHVVPYSFVWFNGFVINLATAIDDQWSLIPTLEKEQHAAH